MGDRMWVGHARTAVERLQHYADLGLEGDDLETMAKILQLHPHFQPRRGAQLGKPMRVSISEIQFNMRHAKMEPSSKLMHSYSSILLHRGWDPSGLPDSNRPPGT